MSSIHKISDLWDVLRLNLAADVGAVAILIGMRCGWNDFRFWQIAATLYGAGILCWLSVRSVKIFRHGVELPEEDFIVIVKPGPNHNVLTAFLQLVSILIFLVLVGTSWSVSEPSPAWIDCSFILLFLMIACLNWHHYKKK